MEGPGNPVGLHSTHWALTGKPGLPSAEVVIVLASLPQMMALVFAVGLIAARPLGIHPFDRIHWRSASPVGVPGLVPVAASAAEASW